VLTATFDNDRYNEYNDWVAKGIQAELKQSKPFSSTGEEASIAILRTADQLQQQLMELLKPYGLSPTQFNALRILRGAGEIGLPCSEIGQRMINHDPDITRLLDRLEQRNYVQRRREQKDRRVHTARITATGLELLKSLDRPVEEFHRHSTAKVGENNLKSLNRLLEKFRNVSSK
jgi:DNA-binding MarR family transcriptional regulator